MADYKHKKYPCDRSDYSDIRKLKVNRLFSFLQRFGTRNKKPFNNATISSCSSINRLGIGPGYRWESIESALSSTTTTSFAFVSAYHLNRNSVAGCQDETTKFSPSFINNCGCSYLQKKYNLLGYEGTPCHKDQIQLHESKKLTKNSSTESGNVEGNGAKHFLRSAAAPKVIPKSHCHRPGKRKAPPPPVTNSPAAPQATLRRIHCRKKGRAPLPPDKPKMEYNDDTEARVPQEATMHNDSLKLEKGILKANRTRTETLPTRREANATSVNPRHWYKRNSNCSLKNVKSLQREMSCAELLDEWMLEVGQPRSLSFHEFCRLNYLSASANENGKRKSRISMLANISELDKEAAEILRQQRQKKEHSAKCSEKKYYDEQSSNCEKTEQNGTSLDVKNDSSSGATSMSKEAAPVTEKFINSSCSKENFLKEKKVDKNIDADGNITMRQLSVSPCAALELKTRANENKQINKVSSAQSARQFSSWTCPRCTLENPSWKFICEACNIWRSSSFKKTSVTESITDSDRHIVWKFDDLISRKQTSVKNGAEKILENGNGVHQNKMSALGTSSRNFPFEEKREQNKLETELKSNFSSAENNSSKSLDENEGLWKVKSLNFDKIDKKKDHFYTEKDRKKFLEILRELKGLFPEEILQSKYLAEGTSALMSASKEKNENESWKDSKAVIDDQPSLRCELMMSFNLNGLHPPEADLPSQIREGKKVILDVENESEERPVLSKEETNCKTYENATEFPKTETQISSISTLCDTIDSHGEDERSEKVPDAELECNVQGSKNVNTPEEQTSNLRVN